jgi:TnpA family transposase
MTWLNAINDRGIGRGAKVVSGTVRDSLHMVDVIFGLDGGEFPEIVVSDTGSYSDVVFGLPELLGISYRPALADLPDQKGWRIKADAGYGPLGTFARGKIDLAKIRRNWEDILRVVASIYTGTVRAYDVVTMLQRDGHPTALGEAIAMYGRIFKSLHILSYIDVDETYRRDIKGIRNLQEGRHALARKICHGKKGELYHRYERALENQLGALGLVLNCVTLWTTVYLDAAVRQLRARGYPVLDEGMARLSPFVSRHLGVQGPILSPSRTWPRAPSATCATPTPLTRTTSSRNIGEGLAAHRPTDTHAVVGRHRRRSTAAPWSPSTSPPSPPLETTCCQRRRRSTFRTASPSSPPRHASAIRPVTPFRMCPDTGFSNGLEAMNRRSRRGHHIDRSTRLGYLRIARRRVLARTSHDSTEGARQWRPWWRCIQASASELPSIDL